MTEPENPSEPSQAPIAPATPRKASASSHVRRQSRTRSLSRLEALNDRKWFVVDAENQVLGRVASEIAHVLRGKHKAAYTPHVDTGDFVIVVNAEKVRLTGKKEATKVYHRHTGWMGGIVSMTAAQLRQKDGRQLIKKAVWGMMPKGPLGRAMYDKLKVFKGPEHRHAAQKPNPLTF